MKYCLSSFIVASLLPMLALPAAAAEFLWLSDIHFDPLADGALVDRLAAAEPEQWVGILETGSARFPGYGRDTGWPLLSSVLQATKKVQPKVAFTMVTGDLLVHHFREQFNAAATIHDDAAFRRFVRKSVDFVGLQLKQREPGTRVVIALGNNDDECGDYAIQPSGPFLHDTAQLVSNLAGVADSDSYVRFGSYSVPNPAVKHQRIIVLNTVFFSPKYGDRCGHSTDDPGTLLLAWLANELEAAKAHREKVWLVYHIPPGVDAYATSHAKQLSAGGAVTLLWKESYAGRFANLLEQYSSVVGPNFSGHIHVDDFRLLGGRGRSSPFVIATPSVSPITGQNPTFRVVKTDSHGRLEDQTTYYLKNLLEAGSGAVPVWQLEYDFRREWRMGGLNAESYARLFERIGQSGEMAGRWTDIYSTSNPKGSSITPTNFRLFYCSAGNVSVQSYQACVAGK
jgi:sphingomyelin phosphodiesterase acid-like 3